MNKSMLSVSISNYKVVSRRDRSTTENRGGVLTLTRADFNKLVHIENSVEDERSWHFLHVDPEVLLLGNWYRPGSSEHDSFSALYEEVAECFSQVSAVVLVGDMNVHHQR